MAACIASSDPHPLVVAIGPSLARFRRELQAALGERFEVVELLDVPEDGEQVAVLGTSELSPGETQLVRPRGRHAVLLVGVGAVGGAPVVKTLVEKVVSALSVFGAPTPPLAQAS